MQIESWIFHQPTHSVDGEFLNLSSNLTEALYSKEAGKEVSHSSQWGEADLQEKHWTWTLGAVIGARTSNADHKMEL